MTDPSIDIDHLRGWIGREESRVDVVDARLAATFAATIEAERHFPGRVGVVPTCIHWCLFHPTVGTSELDLDGHPPRGGFLPPVPLPRRMWAGGRLETVDRFAVGDEVERRSRIADVRLKAGGSGSLCFVTVDHELRSPRGVVLRDRQDIVYRAPPPRGATPSDATKSGAPAASPPPVGPTPAHRRSIETDVTLLFRYSALMFNAHRIHYDLRHAIETEGYAGLVVQGPLQATFLLEFAADVAGRGPKVFDYRGVRPLIAGAPMSLEAEETAEGLALRVVDAEGETTMKATATW